MFQKIIHIIFISFFGNKFFDIKSRANLLEFWTILTTYFLFPLFMASLNDVTLINILYLLYFIIFMPWIIGGLIIRRLHDLNLSGWWILSIIPIFIIPFVKGKNISNQFGNAEI